MWFIQRGLGISTNYPQNAAFASAPPPHFIWDHNNSEQLDILVKEYLSEFVAHTCSPSAWEAEARETAKLSSFNPV